MSTGSFFDHRFRRPGLHSDCFKFLVLEHPDTLLPPNRLHQQTKHNPPCFFHSYISCYRNSFIFFIYQYDIIVFFAYSCEIVRDPSAEPSLIQIISYILLSISWFNRLSKQVSRYFPVLQTVTIILNMQFVTVSLSILSIL